MFYPTHILMNINILYTAHNKLYFSKTDCEISQTPNYAGLNGKNPKICHLNSDRFNMEIMANDLGGSYNNYPEIKISNQLFDRWLLIKSFAHCEMVNKRREVVVVVVSIFSSSHMQ